MVKEVQFGRQKYVFITSRGHYVTFSHSSFEFILYSSNENFFSTQKTEQSESEAAPRSVLLNPTIPQPVKFPA